MRLWAIYNRCQAKGDRGQMLSDVQRLNDAVRTMAQQERAARLLPERLEQLLAEPPPPLAADPRAMAVFCALLAEQAAQVAGRPRVAAEMFGFVLSQFMQPRYAYYRKQADAGLHQIDRDVAEQVMILAAQHALDVRDKQHKTRVLHPD